MPLFLKTKTRLFFAAALVASNCVIATDLRPCADAIRQYAVCEAANQHLLELMRRDHLTAITIMQDVKSGSLIAFGASDPAKLDVNASILPLSTVKLILAASYWDHNLPDPVSADQMPVSEMIVTGNDKAGRRIASELRKAISLKTVLDDLERYGFVGKSSAERGRKEFWAELPAQWEKTLSPASTYHSLGEQTSGEDWQNTLSLGEERFATTVLALSRFLQAVGNDGMMLAPAARADDNGLASSPYPIANRIMDKTTARKLQAAMRAVVERGTAKNVAPILNETGWQLGGKTGTGPGPNPPGPNSDGCFAGLIFDPYGIARFTVVTLVKHGGLGGGSAARISAELALFLARS